MASRWIIIVVDSASELNFHWHNVLKDLLTDIIGYLHPDGSSSQDPVAPRPSLGLVVYGSQGPSTKPQVQSWGWTDHLNTFLEWLSSLAFVSGDFSESALASGLSTALKIIEEARANNDAQGQTHCILVSSYKSSPPLKTVPEEQILDNAEFWDKMDRFLFDAKLVARNFVQSFVSLSVVSPKHSLRLKEIFWAGNDYNPRDECRNDDRENNNYLILLSDSFREAHAALRHRKSVSKCATANHKGEDEGMQIVGNSFTVALQGNQPETNSMDILDIEKWLLSDCDENVKGLEKYGESSTTKQDAVDGMMASLEEAIDQPVTSLLHGQEGYKLTHEAANSILPSNTNHLDFLNIPKSQTIGRVTKPEQLGGLTQNNVGGSSSTCNLKSSYYLRYLPWEQMAQAAYQQKRKLSHAFGQSNTFNPTGSGNFVVNSAFVEKAFEMMNTHGYKTLSERLPGGLVKAWEGDITDLEDGNIVVIDRLVVYRKSSTSQTLFSGWPDRVHLEQFIPKTQLDDMQIIGAVEHLLIDAVRNKSELFQIAEVMCACIKLPHQTLMLYPIAKWSCFVGVLYNGVLRITSSMESGQAGPGK